MADTTVQEGWMTYLQKVVPVDSGPTQKVETRRAFYAGAWHLLQMMKGLPDTWTEDEGAAWLKAREDELRKFYERVGAGLD
jgi:hypothetical protein